jgi:hypothetical protein
MKRCGRVCGALLALSLLLAGCYAPPPPATGGSGGAGQAPSFALQLNVGKNTYRIGENIVISVRSTHSCYLTLYDISTIGEVTQIFPNRFATDNRIEGGYTYPIPDQKDQFDFEITGPPGIERVRGVCTIENVNLVEQRKMDTTEAFPRVKQDSSGEFDDALNTKLRVIPTERWAEASITFRITN